MIVETKMKGDLFDIYEKFKNVDQSLLNCIETLTKDKQQKLSLGSLEKKIQWYETRIRKTEKAVVDSTEIMDILKNHTEKLTDWFDHITQEIGQWVLNILGPKLESINEMQG